MTLRRLSADDIFISYSRKDGSTYALGLADALMKQGFSCFLDRFGTDSDRSLPASLISRLKNCAMLVVVATSGAGESEAISYEISEFSRANGSSRIVPVDFGRTIENARWQPQVVGLAAESEMAGAIVNGNPSPQVIKRIEKAFSYTRSKQRLRRYTLLAGTLLVVSVVASMASFLFAREQLAQARAAKDEAHRQRLLADKERARAEGERESAGEARNEAAAQAQLALAAEGERFKSEAKAREAEHKTATAERMADSARRSQQVAETREREATANAARQEKIGASLRLAAQGEIRLGDRLDLGLLLNAGALSVYDTYETRHGLLKALQHSPRLLSYLDFGLRDLPFRSEDVLLSPDEKVLAVRSEAGLKLLEVVTGREIFSVPEANPSDFTFCSGGREMALGFYGEIHMLNVNDQRTTRALKLGNAPIFNLACDPAGKYMAFTYDYGGAVYLIELNDSGTAVELENSRRNITGPGRPLAFSPDGKLLAAVGRIGQTVLVWDVETKKLQDGWPDGGDKFERPEHVAFSPDGKTIFTVSSDRKKLVTWDVSGRRQLRELDLDAAVACIAVSPAGDLFAVGGERGTIVLWDTANMEEVERLSAGRTDAVKRLTFTNDGQKLIALAGEVLVWDLSDDQHLGTELGDPAGGWLSLAFSPDGRYIASADPTDELLTLRDMRTGKAIKWPSPKPTSAVGRMSFSRDGKILATVMNEQPGSETVVQLWEVGTGRLLGEPYKAGNQRLDDIALSPDGKLLAVSGGSVLTFWDVETRRQRGTPFNTFDVESPYEEELSGDANASAVAENKEIRRLVFSPDGELLACGTVGGDIYLLDLRTVKLAGAMSVQTERYLGLTPALAFSPDGKLLASNSGDPSKVIFWDIDSRKRVRELTYPGFRMLIAAVAFSPDGRLLATAGGLMGVTGEGGYAIILWDAAAGQPLGQPLARHSYPISHLAFNSSCEGCRDADRLIAADQTGSLRLWDVNVVSWQRRACAIANRRLSDHEKSFYFSGDPLQELCPTVPDFAALTSLPSATGRRVAARRTSQQGDENEDAGASGEPLRVRLLSMVSGLMEEATPASRFAEDLKATEDEWAEVIGLIKMHYDLDVPVEDTKKLIRVKDLFDYIQQRMNAGRSPK